MGNIPNLGHPSPSRKLSSKQKRTKKCTVIQVLPPKKAKVEDLIEQISEKWGSKIKVVRNFSEFQRLKDYAQMKNWTNEVALVILEKLEEYPPFLFVGEYFSIVYLLGSWDSASYNSNGEMEFKTFKNLENLHNGAKYARRSPDFYC